MVNQTLPLILIVEDCEDSVALTRRALSGLAQIERVSTLNSAAAFITKKKVDLILLDLNLPDGEGFRLCSLLQADAVLWQIPVLILTARNGLSDRVLSFSVGAADFVTKPFESSELRARVDAKLRKVRRSRGPIDTIAQGPLELNTVTQRARICEHGEWREIVLTHIEFKLLLAFMREPNKDLHRDTVLNLIWGEHAENYSRSVDTHVSKLRQKLGAEHNFISTVHRVGYRFEAPREASEIHQALEGPAHLPDAGWLQSALGAN